MTRTNDPPVAAPRADEASPSSEKVLDNSRLSVQLSGVFAFLAGFLAPWISFVGDRWLDYVFPASALVLFLTMWRAGMNPRDYWRAIPKRLLVPTVFLIAIVGIAAVRVIDRVDLLDQIRMLLMPGVIYLCFFIAVGTAMTVRWPMQQHVLRAVIWGSCVGFTIMTVDGVTGGAYGRYIVAPIIEELFQQAYFNRAQMMLAIASWVVVPFLSRKFGSVIGVIPPVAIWVVSLMSESELVQVGTPIAVAVYFVAVRSPQLARDAAFAAALLALLAAPFVYPLIYQFADLASDSLNPSFLMRAEIWDAVSRFALEAPVFGHGLNATRLAGPIDIAHTYYPELPIWHPHNGFLQIWSDLGACGALAVGAIIVVTWYYAKGIGDAVTPTIAASFTLVVLSVVSTHALWSTWWLGFLALNTGYLIVIARTFEARTSDRADTG